MDRIGIKPDDINSLEDLNKLPFTTKQDLRDNYPFGLFAVPMSEVIRIHSSSGTTGKPTVVGLSLIHILSVKNWKALWESVRKFVWSNPNLLSEARARLKE